MTDQSIDNRPGHMEEWRGDAGLKQLRSLSSSTVHATSPFHATWRSLAIDDIEVGEWYSTPFSGGRRPSRSPDSLLLVALLEGSAQYWLRGRRTDVNPGSMHLLQSSHPVRFTVRRTCRVIQFTVPLAALPRRAASAARDQSGPLPTGRIEAILISLVEQAVEPHGRGPSAAAARAIPSLVIATIEEALDLARATANPTVDALRTRIADHIERHLSDPELGPSTIATDLGVSLRWAHYAFNIDGASIARYIREHRADAAADQIARHAKLAQGAELAVRVGFTSRDQLIRAFKRRFGMTLNEFAALTNDGRTPAPIPHTETNRSTLTREPAQRQQ